MRDMPPAPSPSRTVVLDNGAYTIKCGYADSEDLRIIPNSITKGKGDRRVFIGEQLELCRDFSGLYYRLPFEKGYLTNWEVEKTIWDHVFSKEVLKVDPDECSLLLSEPCFNLPNIQQSYDQFVFEEYEFASYCRMTGPSMCLYNDIGALFGDGDTVPDCVLVIDSGYSFTHIIPFVKRRPQLRAIRRINVGGKLLTNHLKEMVSFRHWNMMDETYLMNEVKETCCYVSQDLLGDLDICQKNPRHNPILQEYVLPDFSRNKKGFIKTKDSPPNEDEQVLLMNNERFTVPEILFHPSDIGMNQAGVAEAIVQAVSATPTELHGLFYGNIVLIGGNAVFPGYKERVEKDLRLIAPSEFSIRVAKPADPVTFAWRGGAALATRATEYAERVVTRAEYFEIGSEICRKRFE
ncbi:uncharacterized protein VTP21DRAFT_3172 [Calcarisporiella thermophila]|uniref:uncharacterized protein n=1 Tax=Calcarisporiella thermophila TaxID=911321 RepID=UPI003743EF8F